MKKRGKAMRKFSKVIAVLLTFVFALNVAQKPAEAANPISPKQSRVTHVLKDANGATYKVYFAGKNEQKAIASTARTDWANVDRDADKGDVLYKGNYRLYSQSTKNSHIKTTKFYFPHYVLNATRKTVYMVPAQFKGQPDMIMVASAVGDGYEAADWFYMRNGVLTQIIEGETLPYMKRPQIIGKNKYQTALYDLEYDEWAFANMTINPTKATESRVFPNYKNPDEIIRKWKKHWK